MLAENLGDFMAVNEPTVIRHPSVAHRLRIFLVVRVLSIQG